MGITNWLGGVRQAPLGSNSGVVYVGHQNQGDDAVTRFAETLASGLVNTTTGATGTFADPVGGGLPVFKDAASATAFNRARAALLARGGNAVGAREALAILDEHANFRVVSTPFKAGLVSGTYFDLQPTSAIAQTSTVGIGAVATPQGAYSGALVAPDARQDFLMGEGDQKPQALRWLMFAGIAAAGFLLLRKRK